MSRLNGEPGSPLVIGAAGGSGTRVVANILIKAGLFLGTELNESSDAMPFVPFYDRWATTCLQNWNQPPPAPIATAMQQDLTAAVGHHRALMKQGSAGWGWKNPRSMLVLPWLYRVFPDLRFVHVIRDGRDMAFSRNQNQLHLHGEVVLGPGVAGESPAVRAIRYWSRVNLAVADYCAATMPAQYLRLRFEDLCLHPEDSVTALLHFAGLRPSNPRQLSDLVVPPDSLGRWQRGDPGEIERVQAAGAEGLRRFGYELRHVA